MVQANEIKTEQTQPKMIPAEDLDKARSSYDKIHAKDEAEKAQLRKALAEEKEAKQKYQSAVEEHELGNLTKEDLQEAKALLEQKRELRKGQEQLAEQSKALAEQAFTVTVEKTVLKYGSFGITADDLKDAQTPMEMELLAERKKSDFLEKQLAEVKKNPAPGAARRYETGESLVTAQNIATMPKKDFEELVAAEKRNAARRA